MIRLIIAIVAAEIIEHAVEYVFVQLKNKWPPLIRSNE